MPNSGVVRPEHPVPVLVRDAVRPTMWHYAVMQQWRWIDQAEGTWEACVDTGAAGTMWVPGIRLRRIAPDVADLAASRAGLQRT